MSKGSLAGVPGMVRDRRLLLALAAATLACCPQLASAQAADYPNRVIRLIVPFAAASGSDLSARHFAKRLTELTGQPVVVDNRAGGNGFPAVQAVKAAPADGYTLLFGSSSTLATNLALFKTLPYDPLADFAPISAVMKTPSLLVVSPSSPYKTIGDVVDAAKKSPGKLNAGTGSAAFQLAAELFMEKTGVKMLNVPYKGVPEVLLAVMSGQVELGFVEISASAELIRTGKLRPLVVASDQRLPSFSNIPTSADAGIPGFTAYTWIAAVAPAATPKPIVDKLSALFMRILASQDTKDFYAAQNVQIMSGGADEMRSFWREQIELWKRIAATAKIELQ